MSEARRRPARRNPRLGTCCGAGRHRFYRANIRSIYYIDRTPATASIYAYSSSGSQDVGAGQDVYINVSVTKPFTLTAPLVLQLNNGVTVQGAVSSFDPNWISFDYTVSDNVNEDTSDLRVTGLAPTSGAITDILGNSVAISGDTGLQIDVTVPCFSPARAF